MTLTWNNAKSPGREPRTVIAQSYVEGVLLGEPFGKVTPFTLDAAATACPLWLHSEFHTQDRLPGPFLRWRIRNPLLHWLVAGHRGGGLPSVSALRRPSDLLPEEAHYLDHFARRYLETFPIQAGASIDHGIRYPTELGKRRLRIGGAVDLLLEGTGESQFELRQLELWGGRVDSRPDTSSEIALALMRLVAERVVPTDATILVVHVDLNNGNREETLVHLTDALPRLKTMLDAKIDLVRQRISSPDPDPGVSCGICMYLGSCGHWDPDDTCIELAKQEREFVSGIIQLTATGLRTWSSCPRMFRARHLLALPSQARDDTAQLGLAVHKALHQAHSGGPCQPGRQFDDMLGNVSPKEHRVIAGYLTRHARRCPSSAVSYGHELTVARFHPGPPRPFMVTGRIDCAWINKGLLDARDYKTGHLLSPRTRDDLGARVQAWLLAPIARKTGLELRVSHEYLAEEVVDEVEPFFPEDDDLIEIEAEISGSAEEIFQSDFQGVANDKICSWCAYSDGCPDSALIDEGIVIRATANLPVNE